MSSVEIILSGCVLGAILASLAYCYVHFHRERLTQEIIQHDTQKDNRT